MTEIDIALFQSRVVKSDGIDACWLYTGPRNKRPDGSLSYGTFRHVLAHRVAWMIAHGQLDPGLKVCHRCDNPPCVRVDHLFVGTQAENLSDMRAKGRARFNRFATGPGHPNAKIDIEGARAVRAMRSTGASCARIGDAFGLHPSTVHDIITGKTWKELP